MTWRALLALAGAVATLFLYVFVLRLTGGSVAVALLGAALGAALWFVVPLLQRAPPLAPPWQAALALALAPAVLLLAMALYQMRWFAVASALCLGALVVAAGVLIEARHPLTRGASGRAVGATLLLAVLALAPAFAVRARFVRPNGDVITRDAALWLRRRLGAEPGVVLASPTATTLMTWFGGFRGIGTLYWENLAGLRASNAIYSATDPDSTRALLARSGVGHLAFFGWDGGLQQLARSAAADSVTTPRGFLDGIEQKLRDGEPVTLPPWLVPLPYVPPEVTGYHHPVVELLEVVPDQPPEVALARQAQLYKALEDQTGMEQALARSLEIGPSVPALALQAQLVHVAGDDVAFRATLARLRRELDRPGAGPIEAGDHVDAAIAFGLANDRPGVLREITAALAGADERQLRSLTPDRLALLADLGQRLALDQQYPAAVALAVRLGSER